MTRGWFITRRSRSNWPKEFLQRPRAEWCRRLEAEDVPYAPIWNVPEVLADPQVRHLQTFYEMQHEKQGAVTGIQRPVLIDGERGPNRLAAPMLGEHTAAIFAEFNLADAKASA